jgi:3-isopropylmalate/(R)-2-methylmalate dehydratase small subunit
LFASCAAFIGFQLRIDLAAQTVSTPDGSQSHHFDIDNTRKQNLLHGWDEIGLSLRHANDISAFEQTHYTRQPWLQQST